MSGNSKKAFDTGYTSVPVYYPDEVAIVGGLDHLSGDERGSLDLPAPKEVDPLYRPKRLKTPLKAGFVESIDLEGVMEDISIILRDGVPVVEYGQMRTRGARRVNAARKAKLGLEHLSDRKADIKAHTAGFPLVSLRCAGRKTRRSELTLSRLLIENNQRHDDDVETTLELMRQHLDANNNNYALTGMALGVTPETVRHLIGFDTHATPEIRAAVQERRLTITAAALLAREKNPQKQNALLARLLAAPDQTVRRAQKISARRKGGKTDTTIITGRAQLTRFHTFVANTALDRKGGAVEDAWWDGVLAALKLSATGKSDDERLAELVKKYEG
jgi:ParB-like chromosome segregation protein Spo0J